MKKPKPPISRKSVTKRSGRSLGKDKNKRAAGLSEVTPLFADGLGLHQAGRLVDAEKIYNQILAMQPDHFESLHLLGLISHQRGNHAEAVKQIDFALKNNPNDIFALNNRGIALKELKRFEEALASYDRALELGSDQAEVLSNRGLALHELKRFEEALASYDRALTLRPDYAEVLSNRGLTLHELKRLEEALASYDRALTLRPDYAEALSNRGNTLRDLNRFEEALASYDRALALRPDYAEVLSNRGLTLHELKRFEDALTSYDRALALRSDYAEALRSRGLTLHELKRFEEALASYDRALTLRPDYAEALSNRGNTLQEMKQFEEARASYDRALALKPDLADAHNGSGNVLKILGELQEAQKACLEALRLNPNIAGVYCNLADLKTFRSGDPHLAAMESLAARKGLSQVERVQLDFALGKAYADLKDYRRSFKHLLAGNVGKRATIEYDETSALALFDRIEAVFTRELIAVKSGSGDPSAMPIFVLGMPRSGTTLVEQIIASHPMVHGAGELQTLSDVIPTARGRDGTVIPFPEFVPALDPSALRQIGGRYVAAVRELIPKEKAAQAERVTDKMPSNYYLVGLIHLALPNAKIIHTLRDPVDTCISCFSKLFAREQNHTYNLGELGRYYKRYDQLMKHWRRVLPQGRILDVRYEDVVADLGGQARRIISYCGLPWDDRCLSFHKTNRPVQTASVTQVRQPIYNSAVGRWRRYEEHLGPLLSALGIVTSVVP
jgi:tetratricopeptide (TPR) repeat protein